MTNDTEARIRARAHKIWEEEGRPEGRARDHWELASELIAIEDSQKLATMPVGQSKAQLDAGEPLIAVENAGEFPTLTDQGEQQIPTPTRKRAAR
jgi:hypothetical protein